VLRAMYFLSFAPRSRPEAHSCVAGLPAEAASSAGAGGAGSIGVSPRLADAP